MQQRRVLISGAGIAGPAIAFWLSRQGWEVTVVERAPALREGGQAVDFRGPVHREVLERMGLWEAVHAHRTRPLELVLIREGGRRVAALPAVMTAGDVEILRGDLSRLLHERTAAIVRYRFGVTVSALTPHADRVDVRLSDGEASTWDLVIGADGLHSGVRALAFGPEERFLRHHGYRLATWSMPNVPGVAESSLLYTEPGRALLVQPGPAGQGRALLVFAGPPLTSGERHDDPLPMLRAAYAGAGWESARVLATLPQATDLYVDEIGSIAIDRYSQGRVVLLGDAAWGGTLGGQGTGVGMVGAYVLARELDRADDVATALIHFEQRMRPYATGCQKGAERVGGFFAPKTRGGLLARNALYRAFTSRLLMSRFEKMVKASAAELELPAYG